MDFLESLNAPTLDPRRLNALRFVALVRRTQDSGRYPPKTTESVAPYLTACLCLNCDLTSGGPIFCSELCSQEASLIRYVRRRLADGSVVQPDIQEAIGIKLLMLTGGGYPDKARELSKAARLAILKRDRHTCQLCGGRASEVDHMSGSSPDPLNLRALCRSCNQVRAFDTARRITAKSDPEAFVRIKEQRTRLAQRVGARPPLRLCDDEGMWPAIQKTIQAARKSRNP
jgi:hypothetical protein